jgi:hypothetical protein
MRHIFRDNRAIIMREYNSGQKQSNRTYAVLQRIVIRKNAKSWRLHLRDVGSIIANPLTTNQIENEPRR